MKTEQYLEVLLEIVDLLDTYDKEWYNDVIKKRLSKDEVYETGIGGRIAYLVTQMKAEIYDYSVKHSGNGKMLSLAKKVLKRARHSPNITFHFARKVGDYTYFSDSTMIIKTSQELKSLEAPDELHWAACNFDFEATMSKLSLEIDKKLALPNLGKLKALYNLEKVKFKSEEHTRGEELKFFFDFGDALPAVDGEKLIEIMDAMPDIELYSNRSGMLGNLYGKSANGSEEILLCPVRKADSDGKPRNFGMHTIEDVDNVLNG